MYDVQKIRERVKPYKDVIVFIITLLAANYFWKWTMTGDEDGEIVTWLGMDVTAPFEFMSVHVARVVYELVALFRDTVYLYGEHTIRFESGSGSSIIWGCTGLKQAFIWFWLIATVPPIFQSSIRLQPIVRGLAEIRNLPIFKFQIAKLWYIPLGWICCYAFNILRIFIITLCVEHHPEWFPVLHDYIFKYLFYGMMFGLWVIFVEKIRPSVSAD